MIENSVHDIPSSMVSCSIDGEEVPIVELAMEGFAFRMNRRIDAIERIQIHFYSLQNSRYEEQTLEEFKIIEIEKKEFYYLIGIQTTDTVYQEKTGRLLREYGNYITCKSVDDSYAASEIAGYPSELDEVICDSFEEQRRDWFHEERMSSQYIEQWKQVLLNTEVAITIDRPERYRAFIEKEFEVYCMEYWKQQHLDWHPVSKKKVDCIYIGNAFCHNLFPKEKELFSIMEKANDMGIQIVLVYTYLRECYVESMKRLIQKLQEWCAKNQVVIEFVVNDLGVLALLDGQEKWCRVSLGTLLNKRRKDPRMSYKLGYDQHVSLLEENATNSAEYQELLAAYGVQGYEYESCGYPMKMNRINGHLHFPYYQTNTSQYCTLYAKYQTGERGKQKLVKNCSYACRKWAFLYPKHLKMVGYYNTIFGLDDKILREYTILQDYVTQGITRIVSNLL